MKKLFTLFAGLLLAGNMMAKTYYDVYICGQQLDSDNKTGGYTSVLYDNTTKTLTFTDAQIMSPSTIVRSSVDDLKIVFNGKNYLKSSTSGCAIEVSKATTIKAGTANTEVELIGAECGVRNDGCFLHIDGNGNHLDVTITGGTYGVDGVNAEDYSPSFNVTNANVLVSGCATACIANQLSMNLVGVDFTTPKDAHYYGYPLYGVTKDDATLVRTGVRIGEAIYPVMINGKNVVASNKKDILGDGKMFYDSDRKELWLDGVKLVADEGKDAIAIYGDVKILCRGTNSVETSGVGNAIVEDQGSVAIKLAMAGQAATLNLKSKANAINTQNELTISGVNMTIESSDAEAIGIAGEALNITNAEVTVKGNGTDATIIGCYALNLTGIELLSKHAYDATTHQFLMLGSGEEATDDIVFGEKKETAVENIQAGMNTIKTIKNGQLVIIREGKMFNAQGAEL